MVEQTLNTEWIDIVDENNEVIAKATRQQMRIQWLRHRATYIVVHDGMGKILVQQRTENKDFYPNDWDATAGGVVKSGESMLETARREAEEELGIAGIPFADHGMFYFEHQDCRVWGGLFSCISHGPFALQDNEIAAVRWMTPKEITAECDSFTPDSLKALALWMTRNSSKHYQSHQEIPEALSVDIQLEEKAVEDLELQLANPSRLDTDDSPRSI